MQQMRKGPEDVRLTVENVFSDVTGVPYYEAHINTRVRGKELFVIASLLATKYNVDLTPRQGDETRLGEMIDQVNWVIAADHQKH
jgi:hypothetical protein